MMNEQLLLRLEQLRIAIRKSLSGKHEGGTPLRSAGGALHFKSHRAYAPGDEFRSIDWNIFARTDQLHVKEFIKDESLTVDFLIDRTPSMAVGSPAKIAYGRWLACALAMIALEGLHAVTLDGGRRFRGKESLVDLLGTVEEGVGAESRESWNGRLSTLLRSGEGKRILFIVSDLWEMEDLRRALAVASAAGNQICLLHILSREEVDPPHDGKLTLIDSETQERRERYITAEERTSYGQLLENHCDGWRRFSVQAGMSYQRLTTDTPLEEAALVTLRGGGVLE